MIGSIMNGEYHKGEKDIMKLNTGKILLMALTLVLSLFVISCQSEDNMDAAISAVDDVMENRGFDHEDTFTLMGSYKDVVVSWESTDTVIGSDGLVNAIGLTSDVEVTIIVTFTEGENEIIKNYTVTVYHISDQTNPTTESPVTDPDEAKIKLVKDNLILPTSVDEDLSLITESNGVSISWSSNNAALTNEGVITRSENDDILVTLTATFISGTKTDTKTFEITVMQIHVLAEAKAALTIDLTVSEDMSLPTTIGDDYIVTITWESNGSAISNTGVVTRDLSVDLEVTLTATLSYNSQTETKAFVVTVLKDPTLSDAMANFVIDEIVVRDINLVSSIGEVSVSWVSSDPDTISTAGIVTRPLDNDKSVTLTATFTYQGHSEEKLYQLVVKVEPSEKLSTPYGFVWQGDFYFFAYATYNPDGYSGNMMAIFETEGEESLTFINASSGGQFSISPIMDQLNYGVEYTVTFIALGDGIDYGDSDPAGPISFIVPIVFLDEPTNLVIDEGILTWDSVLDAEMYEIYSTMQGGEKTLLTTLSSTDTLSVVLPTDLGRYVVEVVAKANNRGDSYSSIEYVLASETLIELDAPVISLDSELNIISWSAVDHAIGYRVVVGEDVLNVSTTSADLIDITNISGDYQVSVIALGDGIYYSDSQASNLVDYTIDESVEKVDASGLLIQANVANNGHYAIEKPAWFSPEGWAEGQYRVEIYKDGVLVREASYNNAGTVVFFQTPGDTNGLLYGLTPGQYTAQFIMIGNGTTHMDSEPQVFVFNFAGY